MTAVAVPDRAHLDDATFTAAIRGFLDAHHPGRAPREQQDRLRFLRDWQALLTDSGWVAPSWPRSWGGMELPLRLQTLYHREMAVARTPVPPTNAVGIVGPTVLLHGTDEQRARWLRPMLRADELWCQGFSEPDAGSDLASLRTRAVLDGDDYVVSGRKVWTSNAAVADRMLLLARTGGPGSGGISCLVVDMRSPGVSVRPLRDMTGGAYFAEVLLDEVRVPLADRIGAHDGGWACARSTLGHERSTALTAAALRYQRVVGDLLDLAVRQGLAHDPLVRQDLAHAVTGARLLELNGARALGRVLQGDDPGPASSISRLQHGLFEQSLHETALRLLGPAAMLGATDAGLGTDGRWIRGFLRTRASTIGAGTAEVQRNTLAEKVLGLPVDEGQRQR